MIKSSKPSKQKKFLYTAPLHVRRKMLAANLSKELRQQLKRRSVSLRKDDEIQVMRGEHSGKKGKISRVDLKNYRVYVEGITIKKVEGTDRQVALHPSNLKVINLDLEDERRARKFGGIKRETEKTEKPKVLGSVKKGNKMDNNTKTRAAQKV